MAKAEIITLYLLWYLESPLYLDNFYSALTNTFQNDEPLQAHKLKTLLGNANPQTPRKKKLNKVIFQRTSALFPPRLPQHINSKTRKFLPRRLNIIT